MFNEIFDIDSQGNKFQIVRIDSTHLRPLIQIQGETRQRNLGTIIEMENGTIRYYKNMKEEHIFRKGNMWGLNWRTICCLPNNSDILIRTEKKWYWISLENALKNKKFMNFKNNGNFELQVFIPIEKFIVEGVG